MKIKDLVNALSEHDYKIAKIQGGDYTFLCKTNEEEVSTIVIIDDIMYPKLADPEQCATISKAFENTFLLRGYRRVNTLFLILTDKPYGFKNFSDGSFLFCVADLYSERLISFMDNDTTFDNVRSSIEEALSKPVKKKFTIKNRKVRIFLSKPFITIALLIINTLIFLYMDNIIDYYKKTTLLIKYSNISTVTLKESEFYRLLTSTFLHADISHLVGNMLSLFVIGYQLEPILGHIKYTALYLLSGIGASVCSVLYYTNISVPSMAVGASGAIFGLFGGYITLALLGRMDRREISYPRLILAVVFMLYSGMQGESIDNAAHLGGVIIGSIITYIYCICQKNKI